MTKEEKKKALNIYFKNIFKYVLHGKYESAIDEAYCMIDWINEVEEK